MLMRILMAALAVVLLSISPGSAQPFQQPGGSVVPPSVAMCLNGTTNSDGSKQVVPCSLASPLPVNATVTATATTAFTAQATLPSLAPGAGAAGYESLSGGIFMQPIFGTQLVDGTHGLPVNCIVGCAAGTTSNAGSGVATSSTNGATVAWLYGFNGTTWDQLQVDASKFLKVTLAANSFGTLNVTGTGTAGAAAAGVLTVQGIASMTPLLASQSGNWTARIVGNAGAVFDFAGQNAASPANAVLMGGQFNTSPTTITNGNVSPFQVDSAGNLLVNIKAGGSTGATSNANSAVATSSTNTPTVAYSYGFNGATWDQLQVDASKNLKITGGVAQGSTTSGQIGSPIMAAVTSAAPSYTTAQTNLLSLDLLGNLRVGIGPTTTASMGIAPIVSGAAEANHVLKSGAGNLYSFQVTSGASAGFVLVFDATSAPGDGAVTPKKCYQLAANSTLGASWIPGPPLNFVTGITVSFSTTGCFTKTASATAFISGEIQ